ncbi:Glucooligosaccharide oxidase [Aplosporella prunicola CBS 121167]|uniref:Glucooligosaccharide oxidase n=1 Tax=Aplosporella prunicola CBS 121167 TaxID=1176127 RepID=A0A6A6AXB7_9PEZI|nr:Glucooligosaccharide oxidase [Aplosporella prunicola CBS 121167]KAF2135574.1 Glucooligosaccharide oxidase [Aplosporella prunicola CBS 121167]
MGQQPSSDGAVTASFRSCLTTAVGSDAKVAFAGDFLYQFTDVKPYNLDIPVTPAAVAYPDSAEQVAAIIACAVDHGHKVQARSGGHSFGNYCLGGANSSAVVIDMKEFQQFSMDKDTWTATVGPGTLLGDLDERLHAAGNRTIAHGTSPQVGTGGHATIGGLGLQSRELGTTADQMMEAEVVLANSSIVRASATENSDLFFAIRGAGASFGVVTEFKFRTAPEPGSLVLFKYNVTLGTGAVLADAFKAWNRLVSKPDLSRKFSSTLTVFPGILSVSGAFFGGKPEFDALNPHAALPDVTNLNISVTGSFVGAVGEWADDFGQQIAGSIPAAFYAKSLQFSPSTLMTDEAADALFAYLDGADIAYFIIFNLVGGKINDIPLSDAAYAHRDSIYQMQSYAIDLKPPVSQKTRDFLDRINEVVEEHVPGVHGAYPGYVDPALPEAQQQYWGANLERLERIKAEIDPTDLFHNPQSVRPGK